MKYTTLGRTGLKVSRICLGTMNFGPFTPEAESHAIMDKAMELGINFFDTADVYGRQKGKGITEQILGNWFALGGGRRERTVLATKVFADMAVLPGDINMARGLSAAKIRRCCEDSLRRLRVEYIDLYQMHHISRQTPWDEIWQAMEVLVQQGKILYVGSSNFAGWHVAAACESARRRNFLGLVSEQSKYSLACRTVELEVLPAARAYGVGVIPWSPLDGGLLGGALQKLDQGRRTEEGMQRRIEKLRPQLEAWENLCKDLGESPANVALAWLVQNPAVTAPIIGPRTIDQMTGVLRCVELTLNETTLARLNEIWPGPGGEAPEAYAW
jgi:aryl-alcohol dehydrogenase-like predicted oxidoreductase